MKTNFNINKYSTQNSAIFSSKFSAKIVLVFLLLFNINLLFAIDAPQNITPNDGSYGVDFYTDFEWTKVSGATRYELQVSLNDDTFAAPIVYSAINQYFLSYDLLTTSTYYWRVRAIQGNTRSNWSEIWSFSTNDYNETPTPQLVSPLDGEIEAPQENILSWNFNLYHNSYDIEIATDEDFTNIVESTKDYTDFYYYTGVLAFNTKYYWRVGANGDNGLSDWSVTWSFTTAKEGIELDEQLSILGQISNCVNTTSNYVTSDKPFYTYEWLISGNYSDIQFKNANKSEIIVSWNKIGNSLITLYRTNTNTNEIDTALYDVFITGPEVDELNSFNICGGVDESGSVTYTFEHVKGIVVDLEILSSNNSIISIETLSETETSIVVSYLQSDTKIKLTLTDLSGCKNSKEIEIKYLPELDAPVLSQVDNNLVSNIEGKHIWYKDTKQIAITENNTYTPTESGNYTATFINESLGCFSPRSEAINFIFNSVEDNFSENINTKYYWSGNNIKLFSNELINEISKTNQVGEIENNIKIDFYNILGEKVAINYNSLELEMNSLSLNINNYNLAQNNYIILVNVNNKVFSFNIIK